MSRALLAALTVLAVLLTGCSSDGEKGSESPAPEDDGRVSAAGISFEAPEGWEPLDADDVAEGAGEDETWSEIADRMGMTPDQLEETIRGVDLFLFSDESGDDFLDNINVLRVPGGQMPGDALLRQQFGQLGAEVQDLSHEETEVGDTVVLSYHLAIGSAEVEGEALYVDLGDGPVSVTISTTDRALTDELADQIKDSLAEAS